MAVTVAVRVPVTVGRALTLALALALALIAAVPGIGVTAAFRGSAAVPETLPRAASAVRLGRLVGVLLHPGHRPIIARTVGAHCSPRHK
ncbi:hypothetical protein EASAB2608_03450 [Streptomyces sp. EAS-AB2608]|uniref:Uncharacterized protein n=1 Tax=Streptomyces bangladeshensis TaxID=295352 RepID=A0ABN3BBX6_9ACTN|nr:hypothetical protein EASAB2608_03450 [Streptomyces sp. EAS-AB2608]